MRSLKNVRWVGGGSGAGKTTVTRLLAERFDVRLYSTDSTIGIHSNQLGPAAAPLLERFRRMGMDERWVRRAPVSMYQTFPWFHGEGFDLVVDDLRQFPDDRVVLAEGFRLLPHLIQPYLSDPRHAVCLLPTPRFREAAFARRAAGAAFWLRTTDPDKALANLLERDRMFTDEVADQGTRAGVDALHVDGTATAEDLAAELATRFGLPY